MKKFVTGLLLCIAWHSLMAQALCGFNEMRRRMMKDDPSFKIRNEQYNEQVRQYMSTQSITRVQNDLLPRYTIQVVFHVVDDDANPNAHLVSQAAIENKIKRLNEIYAGKASGMNPNGVGDMGIQFERARRDPNCRSTDGIDIVKNASSIMDYKNNGVKLNGTAGMNELDMKSLSRWDPTKYYNIWIVNKIDGNDGTSGQYTGAYAAPPSSGSQYDGTVILASEIRNLDSWVVAHEIGHALGLHHPFEGSSGSTDCPPNSNCSTEGDGVCDTDPITHNKINGVVSFIPRSGLNPCCINPQNCLTSSYSANTEYNIMNYVGDNYQQLFTVGQRAKIWTTMAVSPNRSSLARASMESDCLVDKVVEIGKGIIKQFKQIRSVLSIDPKEKVGITSNTSANHVNGATPFSYKIYFENKNTATAPAQEVVITDTLDKFKFDLSTFHLQDFGYGGSTRTYIPSSLTEYFLVDTLRRSGKPHLLVKTDAKLDTAKGILTWRFLSLDQQTNELVADPLDGFLPPNITSPQGEGYVSYSVATKTSLQHGTVIQNKAAIYFDNNAPLVTNEFLNTLDKVKPVSRVSPLPVKTYESAFIIKWSGMDADAGVRAYDIYYSINDGPFQLWQYYVSGDSSVFIGQYDSTYHFYSIAKDHAGNVEDMKLIPEASTTVVREILPLQLTAIEAKLILNDGVITWKTLSESNSSHFELERSIDGVSFDNIVKIQAAGNSNSLLAYAYSDRNILALKKDKIYYRLKMVDKGGSFIYSNIRVIDIPTTQLLVNLAPNPFGNSLRVIISSPKQQTCMIEISDPMGRRVLTDSKKISSGSNVLEYYSVGWKPGIYIVKIIPATGVSKTFKILKK